jgi:hypothetical protein
MKTTSKGFGKWLKTFLSEKGIDFETTVDAEGPGGLNVIPVGCLVDAMVSAPAHEQAGIKTMMVKLDFMNKPILPYLTHLARAVAL